MDTRGFVYFILIMCCCVFFKAAFREITGAYRAYVARKKNYRYTYLYFGQISFGAAVGIVLAIIFY